MAFGAHLKVIKKMMRKGEPLRLSGRLFFNE
jgi:hypothetical protein